MCKTDDKLPAADDITEPLMVFVVDGQRMFAEVLGLGLNSEPDIVCVGTAHSACEVHSLAAVIDYDVAIVDLELPDSDGLGLIRVLLDHRPQARVVMLTAHPRGAQARRALDLGAAGFLGKDASLSSVYTAVRTASVSTPMVYPMSLLDAQPPVVLTPREYEVLQQLGLGREATRIAGALGISPYTTRDYIKAVMRKLGVQSQLDAVVTAERLGLLRIGTRY